MTTKTQIDLTPFARDEEPYKRWSYSKPWVSKGWCYATDRSICVRLRAKDEKDTKGSYPNGKSLFPRLKGRGKWVPFPKDSEGPIPKAQRIGNRLIAGEYIRKINKLPNVKHLDDGGKAPKPLRFRFTGGEGVVMPIIDGKDEG